MTPTQGDTLTARARSLAAKLGAMSEGERLAMAERMPTVCNPSGHFLTIRNTMLLVTMSGRADLTMVAGFRQWLDAGRCVRKGEHAIGCIMVPMVLKGTGDAKPEGEGADGDGSEGKGSVRFRYVPVFDVSQTEELQGKAVSA